MAKCPTSCEALASETERRTISWRGMPSFILAILWCFTSTRVITRNGADDRLNLTTN
jgi:hypothetical protein